MAQKIEEKIIYPRSGFIYLVFILFTLILDIGLFVISVNLLDRGNEFFGGILLTISLIIMMVVFVMFGGLKTVGPNEALVLTLFGKYYGTIDQAGYYFVNPFCVFMNPVYMKEKANKYKLKANEQEGTVSKKTISLKDNTLNNGLQKVNDILGNPIVIGAVVIWSVENPTKAVFQVEDYNEYLSIQTDSTIRNIARMYPYDDFDEKEHHDNEKTLRGSQTEIAEKMKEQLAKRVEFAGLCVKEVRITHLSYSEEIAAAMLQRQQASAIIAARQKIVDGAVGMVKMAIDKLGEEEVVVLDEERKAQMVSNLLVVLCSNKETQPVVNNGSIY